ncbi:phage tail protein [Escherichia coli]|nr:phage tail protein [Escherichia coli]
MPCWRIWNQRQKPHDAPAGAGTAPDTAAEHQEQLNPDGSSYEPRRVTARSKKGRIKRQMFTKLRTTKYLKTAASEDSASVQFEGKVQRIARVHHYGLRDRVSRKGPEVRYAERRLLGVNDDVEAMTRDMILQWLAG